jgi:ketosteroid isomerase-like protein
MRIRECLGALLLIVSALAPAFAQSASPSLEDAERSLADSLLRHDRAAFVAMFAPDAEASFPVARHGPEAIANTWLPFLIDPGTTMLLRSAGVMTAKSGNIGNSTGTLAVRGRTDDGIQTVPFGTYSITWRILDGQWKIAMLGGSATSNTSKTADRGGVGSFRFGMTRTEVSQVRDCQPYTNVSVTGGLECPHYVFEGHEMNISFLFAADRLRRIQLWVYEGESEREARAAVARVLDYLRQTAGGVAIGALPGMEVTPDGVLAMLNSASPRAGQMVHFEICTPAGPQPEVWFSRVGRHQHGYMVLLFADSREGR